MKTKKLLEEKNIEVGTGRQTERERESRALQVFHVPFIFLLI